jgi:hypothetical protein
MNYLYQVFNLIMKYIFILALLFCTSVVFGQKDSLRLGTSYWEDQIYFNVSYNALRKLSQTVPSSGFSYGFSLGYIKDIPFNKRGNISAGIGVGYNFDSFTHSLRVLNENEITYEEGLSSNKMKLNTIEFPIQFRWRTSDAVTYSFWRIYTGVKLGYNLSNKYTYLLNGNEFSYKNINPFNKFQAGFDISAGYGAFNLYFYYGLTPLYKDVVIDGEELNTRIAKFGLIFYLL